MSPLVFFPLFIDVSKIQNENFLRPALQLVSQSCVLHARAPPRVVDIKAISLQQTLRQPFREASTLIKRRVMMVCIYFGLNVLRSVSIVRFLFISVLIILVLNPLEKLHYAEAGWIYPKRTITLD